MKIEHTCTYKSGFTEVARAIPLEPIGFRISFVGPERVHNLVLPILLRRDVSHELSNVAISQRDRQSPCQNEGFHHVVIDITSSAGSCYTTISTVQHVLHYLACCSASGRSRSKYRTTVQAGQQVQNQRFWTLFF